MTENEQKAELACIIYAGQSFKVESVEVAATIQKAGYRKVERGEWERVGENRFRCTVCKSVLYLFAKFCPECGADMRSNKDDKKERINYYD